MDIKGPLSLYGKILGDEVKQSDIRKTIMLVLQFPDYRFETTIAPVVRQGSNQLELSYLTPEEIGETAKLIKEITGSRQHPYLLYLLRMFNPDNSSDERMKSINKLPQSAMFKYRTAARKYLNRTELEKI